MPLKSARRDERIDYRPVERSEKTKLLSLTFLNSDETMETCGPLRVSVATCRI